MAFNQVIAPTTAAVATKTDFDASTYQTVIIAADALAGIEVATIFAKVNGSYIPMVNALGAAAGLTLALPAITLPGGFTYGVTKGATAGACGVFAAGIPIR